MTPVEDAFIAYAFHKAPKPWPALADAENKACGFNGPWTGGPPRKYQVGSNRPMPSTVRCAKLLVEHGPLTSRQVGDLSGLDPVSITNRFTGLEERQVLTSTMTRSPSNQNVRLWAVGPMFDEWVTS